MTKKLFLAAAFLSLAACTPADKNTAADTSAPATASVADAAASEATAVSAPADIAPTEHQQVIRDTQWQSYQCEGGKTLEARYVAGEANAVAQIRYNGQTVTMDYDGEWSNEDLTAFSGGDYTWTISKQYGIEFYKEDNGFLVQHEQQALNGETMPVDHILVQNCAPAA